MEYFFVTDFGSSNSGCAFMEKLQEEPHLLHRKKEDPRYATHYAKEETRFAIKADFLKRLMDNFSSIPDSDFHIKSDTKGLDTATSPNIVWREESLSKFNERDFVYFSNFKMGLYPKNGENRENKILGNDGTEYPIELIIKIFLRLLRLDAYEAFKEISGFPIERNDIVHWGVTIPSIWGGMEKKLIRDIAVEVYGDGVTILSEPQGALTYFVNFADSGTSHLQDGRVSVVIDAGGGTTDLACVVESRDEKGNYSLQSMNLPDGKGLAGIDIDNEFWSELCDLLIEKSGSEKKYERTLNLYDELIGTYVNSSTEGRKDFYNAWRKIQYDCYEKNDHNLEFIFRKDYKKWLKQNNHTEIANYIQDEDGEVPIPRSVVEKCHNTIIREGIVPKVDDFIKKTLQRFTRIDRLILAGGLSYTSAFKDEIMKLGRKYMIDDIQSCGAGRTSNYGAVTKCSGAVAMGAVYQLAHPELMVYSAVKSIWYEVYTSEDELVDVRMDEYKPFNFASTLFPSKPKHEQFKLLRDKLVDYKEKHKRYREVETDTDGNICVRNLSPICVKGCLAANFKRVLRPMYRGQTEIELAIYVSDNPYVLYCSNSNPDIIKLDTLSIPLGHTFKSVTLEITLSNAQNANPILVSITDDQGNGLKLSDIKSQFRKGY